MATASEEIPVTDGASPPVASEPPVPVTPTLSPAAAAGDSGGGIGDSPRRIVGWVSSPATDKPGVDLATGTAVARVDSSCWIDLVLGDGIECVGRGACVGTVFELDAPCPLLSLTD